MEKNISFISHQKKFNYYIKKIKKKYTEKENQKKKNEIEDVSCISCISVCV